MRIAVVGSGIAGLGARTCSRAAHEVELFERDARAGGHANTVVHDGLALDTGFLVHNERNYPLLSRLFRELGVATQESEMSFSVSCARLRARVLGPAAVRAAARTPPARASTRSCWEIGRWLRTARRRSTRPTSERLSLGEYLDEHGYSRAVPLALPRAAHVGALVDGARAGARVPGGVRDPLLRQSRHARLRPLPLAHGDRRQPRATSTRSPTRLGAGCTLGARRPLRSAATPDGVELRTATASRAASTSVVVATHADEALALLEDPTRRRAARARRLRATRRTRPSCTPTRASCRARRAARASWNYRLGDDGRPTITYYLNRLQRLDAERDYCVTLNEDGRPRSTCSRGSPTTHPLYTVGTLRGPARAAAALAARGTRSTPARTSATASTRTASPRGVARRRALGVAW